MFQDDFRALQSAGCEIISARTSEWINEEDGLIFTSDELPRFASQYTEEDQLEAITQAHFVWLHLPDEYIFASTAMEVGWAKAHRVPVFARREIGALGYGSGLIEAVESPLDAVEKIGSQRYKVRVPSHEAFEEFDEAGDLLKVMRIMARSKERLILSTGPLSSAVRKALEKRECVVSEDRQYYPEDALTVS